MKLHLGLLVVLAGLAMGQKVVWKQYPGRLKQVDVGPYGVFGVNSQDQIYEKTTNSWKQLPGALMDISVGQSSVWGVNSEYTVFSGSRPFPNWKDVTSSTYGRL